MLVLEKATKQTCDTNYFKEFSFDNALKYKICAFTNYEASRIHITFCGKFKNKI